MSVVYGVNRLLLVLTLLLLSACSWLGDSGMDVGPTLQELEPAQLPDQEIPLERISLEQVEENYRQALAVAETADIRRKILARLADLEMRRAEQNMLDAPPVASGEGGSDFFGKAIELHQELLAMPDGASQTEGSLSAEGTLSAEGSLETDSDRDKLTYQLAKAYALDGRMQESADMLDQMASKYPDSLFMAEAEFRRAERAFSLQDYAAAERGYAAVVTLGEETPFYHNAVYMRGWSQFKRNHYQISMQSFAQVLDALAKHSPDLSQVAKTQRSLLDDTLRVMSLVASYLEGAETLQQVYQPLGERDYLHLLYRRLAELYLEKRRYRDSAETYKQFVAHYPNSDHAPAFSVSTIDVYIKGHFPSLVLPAKEAFVRHYGVGSHYWQSKSAAVQEQLRPHLRTYLDELAKYQHAKAQGLKKDAAAPKLAKSKRTAFQQQANQHFLQAAQWYQEYISSFPQEKETTAMHFLMAEALFEASVFDRAYDAYLTVAYDYKTGVPDDKAAEAGYSAVIAAQNHLAALPADEPATVRQGEKWRDKKISASLRFANIFSTDKRAVTVLAQAADELLLAKRTQEAIEAASRVAQWQPQADIALRQSAWLIVGQGSFDLGDYSRAETAYREVLALLPKQDARREKTVERIAASIYRAAEQQLAQSQPQQAIEQWLRIRDIAPNSDIAVNAQYESINQLIALQDWTNARQVSLDFRQRYPRHGLTATLTPKLVLIYESMQAWEFAAHELIRLSSRSDNKEEKRTSHYLAADYYRRAGNTEQAIIHFRDYAHSYPQPFAQVMEARLTMADLYLETGEAKKRKFWLRKLIEGDRNAGTQRDDRSRYLGALASSEMATEVYQRFVDVPLSLPLKTSLKKKKRALEKALNAYESILDYEVAEFSTLASYHIGAIYAQLSQDLMDSQRPKNLDALALEQYEILLEEQAFPFEEQAIDIHQANAQRSWDGLYDQWVKRSFTALAELLPARYQKQEKQLEYTDAIY
ncbi:tetratricopeptide repeat protein [Maricurvus nonylphenolicus]|uniref:tetratricopeptide repeat protein n=1 Tax=Maricurvus nonylphenolicus TaxID=1008307 RepID=UPI0036F1FE9B